jgi:hypothetical protein
MSDDNEDASVMEVQAQDLDDQADLQIGGDHTNSSNGKTYSWKETLAR